MCINGNMYNMAKLLFGDESVKTTTGFIDDLKSIGEDIAIDVLCDKQEEAAIP